MAAQPIVLVAVAAALAPAALGQLASSDRLVGWASSPLLPASGLLQVQDADGGCQPEQTQCPGVLLNTTIPHAGGTAYDSRRQAVWVHDDRTLELRAVSGCAVLCSVPAARHDPNATVSGLAFADRRQVLYQLETRDGYLGVQAFDARSCPPQLLRQTCTMTLRPGEVAAGLAYDEAADLLYYVTSLRSLNAWIYTLFAAPATDPCRPACRADLPLCPTAAPLGVVTGLAYSACSERLYATADRLTSVFRVVDRRTCQVRLLGCCPKQSGGGLYMGLAVVPGWERRSVGRSCGADPCAALHAGLRGDPALGNSGFAFTVGGGPLGANAFLLVNGGACTAGAAVPLLCGPWYPALRPPPIAVGPAALAGTAACAGEAAVVAPIPPDPALCGRRFCAQWILLVGSGKLAQTNAVELTIASS